MKHKHWVAICYSDPHSIAIFALEESGYGYDNRIVLRTKCHPGTPNFWAWSKKYDQEYTSAYAGLMSVLSPNHPYPKDDWQEIIKHPNITVYDLDDKEITDINHPLLGGVANIMRSNVGQVSDQGRWLSQADQYSVGSEGETGGPSGLNFL